MSIMKKKQITQNVNVGEHGLPLNFHNVENGLDYELHGDYYFPLIFIPKEEAVPVISKWADIYLRYLKSNKPVRYNKLMVTGKLSCHIAEIDKQAQERFKTLMDGYKQQWSITEKLKAEDPMRWTQLMNNARGEAEWNIMQEIISD